MNVLSIATLHWKIETGVDLISIDFLVDGVSLFTATGADKADLAGCFMSMCVDGVHEHTARMLLGEQPTELQDARFGLFICPICGALSCGAITFQIGRSPGLIRWSAFGFEYDDDERTTTFDRYETIGPFEFDIAAYRQTIEHAVAVISAIRDRLLIAPNKKDKPIQKKRSEATSPKAACLAVCHQLRSCSCNAVAAVDAEKRYRRSNVGPTKKPPEGGFH